ncbi:MAG: peptidase, partial [Pseudonocardia sp.]|nr:peptidase [Pseudonocardia sp.]
TLLVHSSEDTAVPVSASRALAAVAPSLGWPLRYVEVPGVEHTAAWNADPAAYEHLVSTFLRDIE